MYLSYCVNKYDFIIETTYFLYQNKTKNNKNVPKKINFIAIIIMDIVFKHNISMIKLYL